MFVPPGYPKSPIQFQWRTALLCRLNVTDNHKMCSRLYVKWPTILSDLHEFGFSRKTFTEVPNIKFHVIPSSRSGAETWGQTDGHEVNRRFRPLKAHRFTKFFTARSPLAAASQHATPQLWSKQVEATRTASMWHHRATRLTAWTGHITFGSFDRALYRAIADRDVFGQGCV